MKRATDAYRSRDWVQAEQWCRSILRASADQFDALNLLGIMAAQTRRIPEAAALLERAVALRPHDGAALNNLAGVLRGLGRFDEALCCYDRALALDPSDADVHYNRALTLQDLRRLPEALESFERSLELNPKRAEVHVIRGNTLQQLGRSADALESYRRAIEIFPQYAEPWNNRGAALQQLQRFQEALDSYGRALAINPDLAPAHNNRGNALQALGRFAESLEAYEHALKIQPELAELHGNRANALCNLRRFEEAKVGYERALRVQPDFEWLLGNWLHTKMQLCEWTDLAPKLAELTERVLRGEAAAQPFMVLNLIDSLPVQHQAARTWASTNVPDHSCDPAAPPVRRPGPRRIRVGYFSADFHNHATSFLMAGLFERHDREKFELLAFSFGPDRQDEMRGRVAAAFDRFIDVSAQSDLEVAQLSRNLQIDIAVDLKGFTQDKRTGIFAYRAAPVQVSYLGYPGTMGAPFIDYIMADRTVIPQESVDHYSERVVYLPNSYYPTSYHVNDHGPDNPVKECSRADLGLPPTGFVFCCFNNHLKITPETFDGWMRILRKVENSVLWLLMGNETAANNLRKEAEARGVSEARLIFARRMPSQQHLARHRAADLFIDTLPYNAHTTATDALWAGLPVLTRVGESFAARVAASLLNAIGLSELITTTQPQYEALAIELASDPDRLNEIKARLQRNRLTAPLFDTALLTKHIESAYTQMHERYRADLGPDHLWVA
jgi:predicted O-linked N-acetylglucosamine transferase (SPINDLY family)